MPKENPKIVVSSGGEDKVRAIIAERKAALQSFNIALNRLSQVEAVFKAIYSGGQVVNHVDLALFREEYTKLVNECREYLNKMSQDDKQSCDALLAKFAEKKMALAHFWHTDCGPIATPMNAILNHLLMLVSPNLVAVPGSADVPTLSDYAMRQLSKCREQIQGILNKGRGAIGEVAIAKLKADITERYEHYKGKVLERHPEMVNYLPDIETYFSSNDKYSEMLDKLSSRDTTMHVIRQPGFKPPPPPGPSPAERRQAALKAQLQEVVGSSTGESPQTDSVNINKH